jgi:glutathione S-transferase
VPYAWEESLGWEQRQPTGKENFEAEEREDWWYHWKSPALLAANPLGMVPTILDETTGKAVGESLVCIQLVDEIAAANGGSAPSLLPRDPFDRAQARVAAEQVNKTVCSAYYKVLVRPEEEERRAAFADLKKGLLSFADSARGDFWGGPTLGLVDCMLLPYAYRLYVLEHYRGKDFALPTSGEGGLWEKYHAWLDRATALPYVARTLPDKDRYLLHVKKYAEGKARSKVGNAVRRGASAHEYDDKVDGDK